jgi:hypothetical protein
MFCMAGAGMAQQTAPEGGQHNAPNPSSAQEVVHKTKPARKTRPDYVRRIRVTDFNAALVTVAQLEELLRQAHGRHDKQVEYAVSHRVLTERMRGSELAAWRQQMPGKRSREALTALADASSFLSLPMTEIPAIEPPSSIQARHILGSAIEYLNRMFPRLPDFTATQVTTRYADTLKNAGRDGTDAFGGHPWRVYARSNEKIGFRRGKETLIGGDESGKPGPTGLLITGTLESILVMVVRDALRGSIFWSHWEENASGREAVLRYEVPKGVSHYGVTFSLLADKHKQRVLQKETGYHGEISIDPVTGAILRLTVMADLDRELPLRRSDMMVEYGKVELGGAEYILPVRSVAISSGRTFAGDQSDEDVPDVTILNDTVFENYRLEGTTGRE